MDELEILLSKLIPFSLLSFEDRDIVLSSVSSRQLKRGEIFQNKQISPSGILFLKSGLIRVYADKNDKSEMLLFHIYPGEATTFSAPKIVSDFSIEYKMQAALGCEVYVLPDEVFIEIERKYPDIGNNVNELLAIRTESLIQRLSLYMTHSLQGRMELYLKELSLRLCEKALPISQDMIARDLGCSREQICRLISKMRAEGKIETSRSMIKLCEL